MHYIYFVLNKLTGKYYIGKTSQDVSIRWQAHINSARYDKYKNIYFHRAIRKYGKNNFEVRVIFTCYDAKTCNDAEIFFISLFNSTYGEFGYNGTHGGTGGVPNEETRRKQSINTPNYSPEWKQKQRLSHLGHRHLPETKIKMSVSRKGRKKPPRTAEHCEALRKARVGKKNSPQSNEKNRQSNLGRIVSEETKARMRAGWVIRKQKTIEKQSLLGEHTV